MKFHLVSLGCAKNTVDSEGVAAELLRNGWHWSPDISASDWVLVNTCGFIRDAKEETIQTLINTVKYKSRQPNLKIVAFGCLIKRYRSEIELGIPEIDLLFEFISHKEIEILTRQSLKPFKNLNHCKKISKRLLTPQHIGYLKIAEGCNNRCSYCAIPNIRGAFHSRSLDTLIEETNQLVETGAKEIIIIAQDTTRFGEDFPQKGTHGWAHLSELLKKIAEFPEVRWIRLQYLHPQRLSFEWIDAIFSVEKVLPYFDIPLQHISDRILALMNRGMKRTQLIRLIRHIRKNFHGGIIRSTFIVGFPGETEEDFNLLTSFIETHPIDRLGAFLFSTEERTPAARITPKVPRAIKVRRLDELMTLQQVILQDRNLGLIGKQVEVIIDRIGAGFAIGRTFGDSPEVDNVVTMRYDKPLQIGDIVNARILSADVYDFTAEL